MWAFPLGIHLYSSFTNDWLAGLCLTHRACPTQERVKEEHIPNMLYKCPEKAPKTRIIIPNIQTEYDVYMSHIKFE